jgi:hypothetical protein
MNFPPAASSFNVRDDSAPLNSGDLVSGHLLENLATDGLQCIKIALEGGHPAFGEQPTYRRIDAESMLLVSQVIEDRQPLCGLTGKQLVANTPKALIHTLQHGGVSHRDCCVSFGAQRLELGSQVCFL